MKKIKANEDEIYFLDFAFNPALRTLKRENKVLQLRKKQSDVLALLCAKYPNPVSHDDFLEEVWGGSYVTSQSIAQMVRALRIILCDDAKSIIATIPKLGYQLTAPPSREKPNASETEILSIDIDNVEVKQTARQEKSMARYSDNNLYEVADCKQEIIPSTKNTSSRQTWFLSTLLAFFISLIFLAVGVEDHSLSLISKIITH